VANINLRVPPDATHLTGRPYEDYADRMWYRTPAVLLLSMLGGCATLFSDSTEVVTITSNVESAEVLLNGIPVGRTPFSYTFDRDTFAEHQIVLRHPDYQTKQMRLGKTLNKVALFNCSSALFWGTDALSGNMIEYSPGSFFVELQGRESSPSPPVAQDSEALRFLVLNRQDFLRNVADGDGPFLRSLAQIFELSDLRYQSFVAALREGLEAMATEKIPDRFFNQVQAAIPAA
jgi:PEGA domain